MNMNEIQGRIPVEFSGGGQGKAKAPRPKIQGTQFKWKQEKIQVVKKPLVIWPWGKK